MSAGDGRSVMHAVALWLAGDGTGDAAESFSQHPARLPAESGMYTPTTHAGSASHAAQHSASLAAGLCISVFAPVRDMSVFGTQRQVGAGVGGGVGARQTYSHSAMSPCPVVAGEHFHAVLSQWNRSFRGSGVGADVGQLGAQDREKLIQPGASMQLSDWPSQQPCP